MAALLLLLPAGRSPAQQPGGEPPALTKLRADFELRARIASSFLNDAYERALGREEPTAVAEEDYEQARAIKARRDELSATGRASTPTLANVIELPAELAKLMGGVMVKEGSLVNWKTSACYAEWVMPRLAAGRYNLQLSYTMTERPPDPGAAASKAVEPVPEALFSIREVSALPAAAKNLRTLKLAMTKATEQIVMTDVPLEFARPPVTLRLAVTATYPANLITITKVSLVQPSAAPAQTNVGPPVSLSNEWQTFQKTMSQRLADARKPVVESYVASLRALLPQGSENEELAARIDSEQRRAQRLIDDTQVHTPGMKLDSFEELENVAFVPDAANSGDRFKVEQSGPAGKRQFMVRLAWVACPPLDITDKKRLKTAMDRFGVEVAEAVDLGRAAQEFTALYLEGRPLHLLVRQSKRQEDEVGALVFVRDVGLFQSVLLDRGLAVVDAPPASTRGGTEQSLLKGMSDREEAARKQKDPPGGWGLGTRP